PNYVSTSIGKVNYQSLIYAYSRIINFYNTNGRLPNSVTIKSVKVASATTGRNTSTVKTPDDVKKLILNDNSIAGNVLKSTGSIITFIDDKSEVPGAVKLSDTLTVSKAQFLHLTSHMISYLNDLTSSNTSKATQAAANYNKFLEELKTITQRVVNPAPNPLNGVAAGELTKNDYVDLAKRVESFIKTYGRLPNSLNSPIGRLGCDFLILEFSKILNSYKVNGKLPASVETYSDIFKFKTPVIAGYLGAYNIQVTKDYVKATGRCTCGSKDYSNYYTSAFVNYCPCCGRYGTLAFEQGGTTDGNYEGMWYCTHCDADYCLVCGKLHVSGSKVYLKPSIQGKTNSSLNIITLRFNYRILRIFQDSYAYKDIYAKVDDSYIMVKYAKGSIFRFY
ncbi:MAG: pseudomurein-binding repeat-containing protein, partial [Methanothermobacter sp.]